MSVSTWERELSKAQFVYSAHQLLDIVSDLAYYTPKKYRDTYCDHIINAAINAMECAYSANQIVLDKYMSNSDIRERKRLLGQAVSYAVLVGVIAEHFLEHIRHCDGVKLSFVEQYEDKIALKINELRMLTLGVMKSDRKRIDKIIKDRKKSVLKEGNEEFFE